ncbi:hypothetical protein MUN82_00820 [Hymenobacter aerilatus]|uniref:L,D-TPase catalytic domain-containing protein n=1 Tax=Hymenobacter aerilatus TaxID=2932251 RepID=A0A8T9SV68_9BACT|nr:L,D-transpeptidase family protein [Hymenobacter aerilatus]UOR05657.1 hypothetical protein MUN82_00820 [Hymenobacter aerilatus]
MIRLLLFTGFLLFTFCQSNPSQSAFRDEQQRFPRVRTAYERTWSGWRLRLAAHGIDPDQPELFIRAFKVGRSLEVWARTRTTATPFVLVRTFYLAGTSGTLGPKHREGDRQVPEGFYQVDRFNPSSLYHLSLGLNYPNASDLRQSDSQHPGGDIFIHGSNATVGCLPITDAGIEELYVLAVEARAAGQDTIGMHIFPFPLTPENLAARRHSAHAAFWQNLRAGYLFFEQNHQLPQLATDARGAYTVR